MSDFGIIVTVKNIEDVRALFGCRPEAFRINSSHMEVPALVDFVRAYPKSTTVPLYIDLQGSKLRIRRDQEELELLPGEVISVGIARHEILKSLLIDSKAMDLISEGSKVLLDDGKMSIEIKGFISNGARAIVLRGGKIRPGKGFNLNPHPVVLNRLTDRDREIVDSTKNFPFVRYALSFAALPAEVSELKELSKRYIATKIERELSIEQIKELAAVSDELWICRGDLGVQLGLRNMGKFYIEISKDLSSFDVPVIMAGEVMDHMVENSIPTRSEICHLMDLKFKGYSGVVLSNETVYGKYPVEVINYVREVTSDE